MKNLARLITVLMGLSLAACGGPAYVPSNITASQKAPGNFTVPPKIDLLLVEDDTGSMYEAYPQISTQMPGFLNSLGSQGWDFHFATIPLTTARTMTEVAASQYDSNWGSLWIPPYPGALAGGAGMVNPNVFRKALPAGSTDPLAYGAFIQSGDISNARNGSEPGFANIRDALYSQVNGTGFLRPDALLAVLVVGNGNDTSQVNICMRNDATHVNGTWEGVTAPCEDLYAVSECSSLSQYNPNPPSSPSDIRCGTKLLSFNYYQSQFQAIKSSPSQVRFYSAVSGNIYAYPQCLGGGATQGTRYHDMASALGGESYPTIDVCAQPISSVLSSLSTSLQAVRVNYRTRYLFIANAPDPSTIQVTKYLGGNTASPQIIPQDPNNGWTYDGYVQNVYGIDYPVQMDLASGYAVELHGSAKLLGSDTADVTFKLAGSQSAAAGN